MLNAGGLRGWSSQQCKGCKATRLKSQALMGNLKMTTQINKVDKGVLLTIPNPKYEQLINRYHHLQQLVTDDNDKNSELLIHVILGSSEYSGIKTATKPQVGQPSEPSQNLHIWDGQ